VDDEISSIQDEPITNTIIFSFYVVSETTLLASMPIASIAFQAEAQFFYEEIYAVSAYTFLLYIRSATPLQF
jgi:hypothetical protein